MIELTYAGADIGAPKMKGSTAKTRDGLDMLAGGADIWGPSDQFHFAYAAQSGDFDLSARLVALSMADDYTKAGIMARESLRPDCRHAYILAFPDNRSRNRNNGGFEFQYREGVGSESKAIYPADFAALPPLFPVDFPDTWMRLTRSGDRFESFSSADGREWKLYSSFSLQMSREILLGFAVTSHNEGRQVTAKFANISMR
jgi:hypothetical protein